MREFKFRGKSVKSGKWYYGYLIKQWVKKQAKQVYTIVESSWVVEGYGGKDYYNEQMDDAVVVQKDTIGQLTGFKDDLGNDIYEGDVLQGAFSSYLSSFDERTSKRLNRRVVKWVNNGFYLCFWNGKVSSGLQLKDNNGKRYRVIGNIYDDPELQEEDK